MLLSLLVVDMALVALMVLRPLKSRRDCWLEENPSALLSPGCSKRLTMARTEPGAVLLGDILRAMLDENP